ncbi:MAG: hypothetical protein CMJ83_15685 [Planctomycetes bacterium]|nr:hypothetical protein [Planctomycetota bacterium]
MSERQVVDTDTAQEFMSQILDVVDVERLAGIATELEAKSAWFQERLTSAALASMTSDGFEELLGRVFATRGKTRKTLLAMPFEDVRAWMADLLYGDDELPVRFQRFADHLDGVADNLRIDFASELLHFNDPERHWLWTRWMWDPKTKTGSVPLVTYAEYDLGGETAAEVYMKIGRAVAFVHEVGGAAGFQTISRSIFGTDVFLCCVYVVYAYTVLKMRMTQEFNKVMPGLTEFCRRLLGLHRKGPQVAAAPGA